MVRDRYFYIISVAPPGAIVIRGDSAPLIKEDGTNDYFCGNNHCILKKMLVEGGHEGKVEAFYFECPSCHTINYWNPAKL
jgi:hypothetical protein